MICQIVSIPIYTHKHAGHTTHILAVGSAFLVPGIGTNSYNISAEAHRSHWPPEGSTSRYKVYSMGKVASFIWATAVSHINVSSVAVDWATR